ncbi:MAG: hypothetical protein ACKPKO_06815, partial [Candidatus Fonsibacter sp.]
MDDDDNDDSDDEAEEDAADPLDTEESRLTTEDDVPDTIVGQIIIKTLTGQTITVNDVTTNTNIIDIKGIIEEKDCLSINFQRLYYNRKTVKDNRTVGYH